MLSACRESARTRDGWQDWSISTLIFPGENPGQWAVGTQDNMLALPLKIEGMLRAGIG